MGSRFAEVTLDWGGNPERVFRLGIGQIGKLQEKLDAGPVYIASMCLISMAALRAHATRDYGALSGLDLKNAAEITHVRAVILQGLLGMNMPLPEAERLVRDWVDERPLSENLMHAYEICMGAVLGVEDEKPAGEPKAAKEDRPTSPAASTVSEKTGSMPSAPPADSQIPAP